MPGSSNINFTEGPIYKPLVRFTIPLMAASLLQTAYGAVDLLVVGQFSTAADVSAVSTGSWLMQLFTVLIIGLSLGTTVLLGRCIGRREPDEAGRFVGVSIFLFAVLGLILTVVIELVTNPLVKIMQVPDEAVKSCTYYLRICAGGFLFITAYNMLGSIFRGIGDSKVPLLAVAVATVTNIVGDILLVGPAHLGAAGAAIATVAAQALSVMVCLIVIARRQNLPYRLKKEYIRHDPFRAGQILRLGIPTAASDLLVNVSFLFLNALVNTLGVTASAGMGVAERLCGFIMVMPSSFGQAIATVSAQNYGAGKPERAKRALLYSIMTSFVISIFTAYLSYFHGDILSSWFARDPGVIAQSADYLKAYSIDCLLTSFMFNLVGYYNGLGHTTFTMAQSIIGALGVRIPFSYLFSHIKPVRLFYIGLATPLSTLVQNILCLIFWFYLLHKDKKQKEVPNYDTAVHH